MSEGEPPITPPPDLSVGDAPTSSADYEEWACTPKNGGPIPPLCEYVRASRRAVERSDRDFANEYSQLLAFVEAQNPTSEEDVRNAALNYFRDQRHPINQTDAAQLVGEFLGAPSEDLKQHYMTQRLKEAGTGADLIMFVAQLEADLALSFVGAPVLRGVLATARNSKLPIYYVSRNRTPGIAEGTEIAITRGQPTQLSRIEGRAAIRAQRRAALRGPAST